MNAYNKLKEWVLLLLVDLGRLTPEEANNILMEKKIWNKNYAESFWLIKDFIAVKPGPRQSQFTFILQFIISLYVMHRFWTEIPSINMVHLITQIGNYIPFVKLNSMGSFVLSDENLVELVQNLDLTILAPNDLESLIYGKEYSIFELCYNKITYNEQIFFTYVDILFTYMTYLVNLLFVIVAKMVQTALAWRWVHVWYGWYPKNSLLYLPNILASRILFPFAQRYQAKARRWQLGNIYLLFVGVYAEVLIKVYTMPLWCRYLFCQKKITNYITRPLKLVSLNDLLIL